MSTSHWSDSNLIFMPDEDTHITQIANTASEHIAALRLVADSVAQQRQLAARGILFNPFCWALILPVTVRIYYSAYKGLINLLTLAFINAAVLMAFGMIMKWSVAGYLDGAEKVDTWRWLYGFEEETKKKARGHDKLIQQWEIAIAGMSNPRQFLRNVIWSLSLDLTQTVKSSAPLFSDLSSSRVLLNCLLNPTALKSGA
jgi:hypothetical protein